MASKNKDAEFEKELKEYRQNQKNIRNQIQKVSADKGRLTLNRVKTTAAQKFKNRYGK
jgi:hypothetical protein